MNKKRRLFQNLIVRNIPVLFKTKTACPVAHRPAPLEADLSRRLILREGSPSGRRWYGGPILFVFLFLISLLIFVPRVCFADWSDDFTDGNFTSDPTWGGDTGSWQINVDKELQLSAPGIAQWEYLSTASTVSDGEWIFYFKYAYATPSAANCMRVYLMSSAANLEGELNGYYVTIGQTSADYLKVYKKASATETLLKDTGYGDGLSDDGLTVKVTRSGSSWELFADTGKLTDAITTRGTWTENTYNTSSYFGVSVNHSVTYLDKWRFDNFSVTSAAVLIVTNGLGATNVTSSAARLRGEVTNIGSENPSASFYWGDNDGETTAENWDNQAVVPDSPDQPQGAATFYKDINGLSKNTAYYYRCYAANSTETDWADSTASFTTPVAAGDVVISELFYDETGTDAHTFVELYNTTGAAVTLTGWTMEEWDADDVDTTPHMTYSFTAGASIPSHGYYLIGQADPLDSTDFGSGVSISPDDVDSFPNDIYNTNSLVALKDNAGTYIDGMGHGTYTNSNMPQTDLPSIAGVGATNSIEREPGCPLGNATDTDDNSADCNTQTTPNPQNSDCPVVSSVIPTSGGASTEITITGTKFVSLPAVELWSNTTTPTKVADCTEEFFTSATEMTAIIPSAAADTYYVVVTNPNTQKNSPGTTFEVTVVNTAPVNNSLDLLSHADDATLYAGKEYTWQVKVTDDNGVTNLDTVVLKLDGAASYPVEATWTQSSDSFAISTGSGYASISSTGEDSTVVDNQVTLDFKITLDWDYPNENAGDDQVVSTDDVAASDTDDYTSDTWTLENDLRVTSVSYDSTQNPSVSFTVTGYLDYEGVTSPDPPEDCADVRIDPSWTDTNYDDTDLETDGAFSINVTSDSSLGDTGTFDVDIIIPPTGAGTASDDGNTMDIDRVQITGITISSQEYDSTREWDPNSGSMTATILAQLEDATTAIAAGTATLVSTSYGASASGDISETSDTFSSGEAVTTLSASSYASASNLTTYDNLYVSAVSADSNNYGTAVSHGTGIDEASERPEVGWDDEDPTSATVAFTADTNTGAGITPNENYDDDGDLNFTVSGASDGSGSSLPTNRYAYQIDDLGYGSPTSLTSQDYTSQADGDHHCDVKVIDNVGNYAEFASPPTITVDISDPTANAVTFTESDDYIYDPASPDNKIFYGSGASASAVTFTASFLDAGNSDAWKVLFPAAFNDAGTTDDSSLYTYEYSIDGGDTDSLVTVTLYNNAGNQVQVAVTTTKDSTAPTDAGCSTPAHNATNISVTPTLTAQAASDAGAELHDDTPYSFELDDNTSFDDSNGQRQQSGWQASDEWGPSALSNGTEYHWRVKAKDNVGNESIWFGHTTGAPYYGTFTTGAAIAAGDILVNEVAFVEATSDWIEIYVKTTGNYDGLRIFGNTAAGDATLVKTFPDVILSAEDYVVLHFNGDPGSDETSKGSNGYWDFETDDTVLLNTDCILSIKRPTGDDTLIDVVIYSTNDANFTGDDAEANAAVSAGHWDAGASFNGKDSDAWTKSGYVATSKSIGRNENSTDTLNTTNSGRKTDWHLYTTTHTKGARNGSIVINEVLYDPVGTDTGLEWIEIYNDSTSDIDLENYQLRATVLEAVYYTFPAFTLNAGAYVVVHWRTVGDNTATHLYTGTEGYAKNMGDAKDALSLWNDVHAADEPRPHAAADMVDYIEYGAGGQTAEGTAATAGIWTAGDCITAASIVGNCIGRSPNGAPNGYDNNASGDWTETTGDTPGAANSAVSTTTTISITNWRELY